MIGPVVGLLLSFFVGFFATAFNVINILLCGLIIFEYGVAKESEERKEFIIRRRTTNSGRP